MNDIVDISGLDKAAVLAALFNASASQGLGFLQTGFGSQVMSLEDAQQMMFHYDYVDGRPLKVKLGGDEFDSWGFDRDNGGPGSAQKVIDRLRETSQVNSDESAQAHTSMDRLKS